MIIDKFNNLKLKYRILSGYSVPVLITLGAAGLVLVNYNRVSHFGQLAEDSNHIFEAIQAMAYEISNEQKTARSYVIDQNDIALQEHEESKQAFDKAFENAEALIQVEEQQAKLAEILELEKEVTAFNERLISLAVQGNLDQALALWRTGTGQQLTQELDQLIQEFLEAEEELLVQREAAEDDALRALNATVIISSLLASALMVGIGVVLASTITKTTNETVTQIATSSAEIAATAKQQERTSTEQASSVSQTTTTMEELGASTRQSTEQAEASATNARQALELAEEGNRSVEQTVEGINTLKDQVSSIAEQIMRLSEQTGQISLVSELVGNIANQTNMLALNASVEAARAGEGGKGFSVVAGEIRKLAEQSKKSAEKINGLVRDIQASLNSSVMVTDEGTKKADEGIKLAEDTAETFSGVAEAINNVFLNSQQIAMTTKQQAVAVQQVVSAMNELNVGAQETASGINQVKSSIQQLDDAAQRLKARTA